MRIGSITLEEGMQMSPQMATRLTREEQWQELLKEVEEWIASWEERPEKTRLYDLFLSKTARGEKRSLRKIFPHFHEIAGHIKSFGPSERELRALAVRIVEWISCERRDYHSQQNEAMYLLLNAAFGSKEPAAHQ